MDDISFVDEIMNKDLLNQVVKVIQTLKPLEQEVINLRLWEEMPFEKIAEMQDEKETTVKNRFYRAIEKIRAELKSKNIKALIALPVLFTALAQAGTAQAYSAPISISASNFVLLKIMDPLNTTAAPAAISGFLATKAGIAVILTISTLAGAGLGIGGTSYYNSRNQTSNNNAQVTSTPTPTPTDTVVPTTSVTVTSTSTLTPTPNVTAAPKTLTDAIYFNGSITETEKSLLLSRVINPYLEYNQTVASIMVNTQNINSKRSFLIDSVFYKDTTYGTVGYNGFVVDMMSNGQPEYWIPECVDYKCTFTQTFKTKYPQNYQRYITLNP